MHEVIAGGFTERRIEGHAAERLTEVRAHDGGRAEKVRQTA
jgi:hypothetical protein